MRGSLRDTLSLSLSPVERLTVVTSRRSATPKAASRELTVSVRDEVDDGGIESKRGVGIEK